MMTPQNTRSLSLDDGGKAGPPTAAVRCPGAGELPARVAARPRPELWAQHELLTLPEAAVLFWPDGLLTVSTLRTAAKHGQLAVAIIAGRLFTSPAALQEMAECRLASAAKRKPLAMGRDYALDRILRP